MARLLSVNTYHYRRGGSDVVYLDHAALMEQQGWENAFFAMHHPKNQPTPWSRHFVEEIEFGHAYSVLDKIRMAAKVVYSWEARRKIGELVDEFRPDVAHLHCIYHHLSPSILPALSARGVPAVMTAHDLKVACPAYKMLNRGGVCERCREGSVLNVVRHRCVRDSLAVSAVVAVESGLQRAMDTYRTHLARLVVPSRFFGRKLQEWGWRAEQMAYIPNYVDATRFEPAYAPGRYALYFGRLALEKGVATLIRSAHAAKVPLKLAGTGPEEAALKRLAAELGADAEFLGFQAGEALHQLVRAARVVVLPSEWYENAPMSVLESFAMGKPVIGADIGGIPEMIVPGETGWAFPSRDVQALAATLGEAFGAPDSRLEGMGVAARARVQAEFTRDRYVNAMLDLYAGLGVAARPAQLQNA